VHHDYTPQAKLQTKIFIWKYGGIFVMQISAGAHFCTHPTVYIHYMLPENNINTPIFLVTT
jgi:hypothetical protein